MILFTIIFFIVQLVGGYRPSVHEHGLLFEQAGSLFDEHKHRTQSWQESGSWIGKSKSQRWKKRLSNRTGSEDKAKRKTEKRMKSNTLM